MLPTLVSSCDIFSNLAVVIEAEVCAARTRVVGFGEDEDSDADADESSAKDRAAEDSGDSPHVVVTVALNVFVKLAGVFMMRCAWCRSRVVYGCELPVVIGKHFTLMQAMPCLAATAFHGLTRLFDVYFYTVACSFLPQVSLHALFAHFEALESGSAPASSDDPDAFPHKDPVGAYRLFMLLPVEWGTCF